MHKLVAAERRGALLDDLLRSVRCVLQSLLRHVQVQLMQRSVKHLRRGRLRITHKHRVGVVHIEELHGVVHALDDDEADAADVELLRVDLVHRVLRDEDARAELLRQALHARAQVHVRRDDGAVDADVVAEQSHAHLAGVQGRADAHDGRALELAPHVHLVQRHVRLDRGLHGALRVHEEGHRRVADVLVDEAAVLLDHLGDAAVVDRQPVEDLRVGEALGDAREVADVGEEHRDPHLAVVHDLCLHDALVAHEREELRRDELGHAVLEVLALLELVGEVLIVQVADDDNVHHKPDRDDDHDNERDEGDDVALAILLNMVVDHGVLVVGKVVQ
eukprot:PhM_4_TR8136/c0_g1_i4/m.69675